MPSEAFSDGVFIMWILAALIAAAAILYLVGKRPQRRLPLGRHVYAKQIEIQGATFYLEETAFPDYHQAIHNYYRLIPDLSERAELLETQYSYLDWTNTILRFPDCTLQLVRRIDRILLIQSQSPMSIAEFERLTEGVWEKVV